MTADQTVAPAAGPPGTADDGSGQTPARARRPRARSRAESLARLGLPLLLVLFIIVFSALRPDTFATFSNLRTILSTQSALAILALSALVVLVIGEFDLSIAAQLGLAALLVPGLTAQQGLPVPAAVVVAVLVCVTIGVVNGLMVAGIGINSFIVTIGMSAVINAIVLWYSGGSVIFEGVPDGVRAIAGTTVAGMPIPVLYAAVIATLIWFLVQHTPFGRYMAAVGGSKSAAELSGIAVGRTTVIVFALAGALAGIGGVVLAGQLGTGNPAVGPSMLLPAFAAVFLGATSFRVGTFNTWGTVTAVVTIATGVAGLNLIGVPQWVNPAFNGLALLVAVTATRYLRGRSL